MCPLKFWDVMWVVGLVGVALLVLLLTALLTALASDGDLKFCLFFFVSSFEGGKKKVGGMDKRFENVPTNVFQEDREARQAVLARKMNDMLERKRKAFLDKQKTL